NGVGLTEIDGVTGDLAIGADATLDTDMGAITLETGAVARPPGFGLAAGLRYTAFGPEVGVLGVRRVVIGAGATLHVHGPGILIVLAKSDISIAGVLDASAGWSCSGSQAQQCAGPGGGVGGGAGQDGGGCSPGGHGYSGLGAETGGGGGGYGSPKGGDGGSS